MQSFRALGYSVEAAVADLVDNSIAAGSRCIDVTFAAVPEPHVAIVDDGEGMDEATLVEAMRFGSRDPRDARDARDLGRFGLGMKTASLSQCRRVTVISLRRGQLGAAEWDLEECEKRDSWWLRRPAPENEAPALVARLREQGSGTVVLWRHLDRLAPLEDGCGRALDDALAGLAEHLGFTFHRFTDARAREHVAISLNGREVPAYDPFLEGHTRGQMLQTEELSVEGSMVTVTPFVLPFPSRLSEKEMTRAGGRERLKSGHGFYIYRGGRLVVPGGWFRIVPSDELVRLARVRVDVPIELDHLWKLDIRKTVVDPPRELRQGLRRIVGQAASRSRKIYQFRGNASRENGRRPLWLRTSLREGAVSWSIDREHPAVRALCNEAPETIDRLLRLLEQNLPVHDIHVHLASDIAVEDPDESDEELEDLARRILDAVAGDAEVRRRMLNNIPDIEPFSRLPEATRRLMKKLEDA
jgi:hypothetical protein